MYHVPTRGLAAALLLATSPMLAAQGGPPVTTTVPPVAATKCGSGVGRTALRAATGGAIGAWLGFVAAKIKLSDWNESSHSASAARTRNLSTIGGAAIGMALGSLLHVGNSCAANGVTPSRIGREPITADEIQKVGRSGSVYDLVYSLRRNWLNLRGHDALTEGPETLVANGQEINLVGAPRLTVYLDNARLGSIDELRTLPVAGVSSVRFFDGPEATHRWGAGNSHGAIQVLTGP